MTGDCGADSLGRVGCYLGHQANASLECKNQYWTPCQGKEQKTFAFMEVGNVVLLNAAHFNCSVTYQMMNGGIMRKSNKTKELGAKVLLPLQSNTEYLGKTVSFTRLSFL